MFSAARRDLLLIALLTSLVLALPTRNSTADAWYYAACVRHSHDLLLPHHLLYNAIGWLWVRLLAPIQSDTLAGLLVLNGLAYGAILLTLRALLRLLQCPPALLTALLLVTGSSFGLLRFGTENETYILPLLLSLLASRSWVRYLQTSSVGSLLTAGAWAAGACLVHQLHVWWWLGLFIGTLLYSPRRWAAVVFVMPALAVPAAYWGALSYWSLPHTPVALMRFVLHDFLSGTAGAPASVGRAALLTVANVVRTFVQVHGSTFALLRRLPALAAVPAAGAVLLFLVVRRSRRDLPVQGGPTAEPVLRRASYRTHLLVLVLQLAFAAWASGNAEFMVMLPVLLALLIGAGPRLWPARPVAAIGGALLLWNLAFGLLPNYFIDFTNLAPLLARVQQESRTWFLLDNHNLALNRLYYFTGHDGQPNVLPAPVLLAQKNKWNATDFQHWVRVQYQAGRRVSTDAVGGPQLLDRARLTQQEGEATLLRGLHLVPQDSFPTFFGPRYLTELR